MSLQTSGDPNTPNLEDLLRLGIRTAQSGNKQGARMMFEKVLNVDKRNERAWLWMASVAENEIDRRRYLETVLKLNPKNAKAKRYLSGMDQAVVTGDRDSIAIGVKILVGLAALIVVVALIAIIISRG
jgi:thioredoxin-like negative regulator of GroEL